MKNTHQESDSQQGWVKLPRNLLDTPIMKNSKLFHIYGWCLMRANHKDNWVSIPTANGNKEIMVKKGQFIMGRKKAAEFLGMPESTFYTNIKKLQDYGLLSIESNNQFSLVTLIKSADPDREYLINEQPVIKNDLPEQTTSKQPANTNNNYKNNNKINKMNINNETTEIVSLNKKKKKTKDFKEWAYTRILKEIEDRFPDVNRLSKKL